MTLILIMELYKGILFEKGVNKMLRKLKRSVAHAKMDKEGLKKINRKAVINGRKVANGKSYFAENWKKYI